jgi:DNA polymerase I
LVQLEFDGRYAAMLSHEPKNYALMTYDGKLILRGVAFRSSRAEPFGDVFLRRSIERLLAGDVAGVRDVYVTTLDSIRHRELPTYAVSSRVRLTKTAAQYLQSRDRRRELPYEAMLASGRETWSVGDRVRVYRTKTGAGGVVEELEEEGFGIRRTDPRDYDVTHYARLLHDTYAVRMARAFTPNDYAVVFADPGQMSLFTPAMSSIHTVLDQAD